MPWLFLSVAVILWGLAPVKALLNGGPRGLAAYRAGDAAGCRARCCRRRGTCRCCTAAVFRDYPVVPGRGRSPRMIDDRRIATQRAEAAVFTLNWASATGTAILLAALATALFLRVSVRAVPRDRRSRPCAACAAPLATIMLMLALGFVTRYGGTDATLGLAFTKTGVALSVLCRAARLAGCRADGIGHELERAVRQPAEDHGAAARVQPGADRHGQQHRRRHGQDDRRAEHRRRHRVHGPGRPGRTHPAVRVLAQRRARHRSWARS